jgi:hypothetical protein
MNDLIQGAGRLLPDFREELPGKTILLNDRQVRYEDPFIVNEFPIGKEDKQ